MREPVKPLKPMREIARGLRAVTVQPFLTLTALSVLVGVVASSRHFSSDDGVALVLLIGLSSVQIFIQIATLLAAAESTPASSADRWLVAAFRNRSFWRFLGTALLLYAMVVVGLFALLVVGFIIGGVFALSLPAAAIERRMPIAALKLSATLTRQLRGPMIIIFGVLYILPVLALNVVAQTLSVGDLVLTIGTGVSIVCQQAALISVGRIFVAVRGNSAAGPPAL